MENVLTVDVEDWYTSSLDVLPGAEADHGTKPDESVVRNTNNLLELLAEHGHAATFFILGTVAEHYPEVVRAIADAGHEIGVHGYSHRLVYDMTPADFKEDLLRCVGLVEEAGANGPFGYRAPYWSITDRSLWALGILANCGISYDASIFPISRGLYGIPDAPPGPHERAIDDEGTTLWEFPPATVRVMGKNIPIAGGGYLRILPYSIVRWGLRRLNATGSPAIMYLHPYELDPSDIRAPSLPTSIAGRISYKLQRLNRERNPAKIKRLLGEFEFTCIRDAFANVLTTDACIPAALGQAPSPMEPQFPCQRDQRSSSESCEKTPHLPAGCYAY